MPRRILSTVKAARLSFLVILVSALVAGGGLGVAFYLRAENENRLVEFAVDLRDGLIRSCQRNGNPLREAVADQIRRQVRQRRSLDYGRFFPNVPPAELAELLAAQESADRATLRQIAPINCAQLYPNP